MRLSVLTLNLWNISEPLAPRRAALTAGIRRLQPDLVFLQEVARDPASKQLQSALVAHAGELAHIVDGEGGLAIVSRFPVQRSACVNLPEFARDEPRYALLATCQIEAGPLLLANTHLASRLEMTRERTVQVDAVLAAIDGFSRANPAEAKILCGDFNDDPDSPAIQRVLTGGAEFRDAFGQCHPRDLGFTYSLENSYVPRAYPRSQRVDYVFTGGSATPQVCSVVFDGRDGLALASDHYGVLAEFAFL
jgi:endonuclease/exonuclease/phosphatase family metal-dependent hydrolase